MTSLSAEKPHDMIIGRAKRGQISRTDSEFFNGIGRQQSYVRSKTWAAFGHMRGGGTCSSEPVRLLGGCDCGVVSGR